MVYWGWVVVSTTERPRSRLRAAIILSFNTKNNYDQTHLKVDIVKMPEINYALSLKK